MNSKRDAGDQGEELACSHLDRLGYQIIVRNYYIRGGEIDIVAKDGEFLVFIEVKTRWSHEFGLPVESITPRKIKHLLKTARFYLAEVRWEDKPYRLDFVSVDFTDSAQDPRIELIKNITGW